MATDQIRPLRERLSLRLHTRSVGAWRHLKDAQRVAPKLIRSDNGSEFIKDALQDWMKSVGIKTLYIEPGSPWNNGFTKSLHSGFSRECLKSQQLCNDLPCLDMSNSWLYNLFHQIHN